MFTPYDREEAAGYRKDNVENRLREGSPVVGVSYDKGLLLLTVRRSQRKVYELYDRQMFSAIGMQSDIENVRVKTIQIAHQEGFERSPDDVTLQRLVGFILSPSLKQSYGDMFSGVPYVIRALFAEIGKKPQGDGFYTLNYDGEFRIYHEFAVIAGSQDAEDKMLERLEGVSHETGRDEALQKALSAWIVGAKEAIKPQFTREEEDLNPLRDLDEAEANRAFLLDELKTGTIEVGILERDTKRESRFRLLTESDLTGLLDQYRNHS